MTVTHSLRLHVGALIVALVVGLAITACGGSSSGSGSGASKAESGKQIFTDSGCAGCHALAAAGSSGSEGPNLDKLKPSYAAVVKQVTNGGGVMPSFKHQLSTAQIDAVARFVYDSTHGS